MNFDVANEFRCILSRISPKLNTKVTYYFKFKKFLNLNNPETLNEKILWLKFNTYWKNPLIKQCADNYRVREYLKEKGHGDLLNPIIGVYDDVEKINWDSLPQKFAIKFNVGCGKNIIVKDKGEIDIPQIKKEIQGWFGLNYWQAYSEMQYKDVKPYVILEQYLASSAGELPEDYKFFCMNGKCVTVMICKDRVIGDRAKYFFLDREWNLLPYTQEALDSPNEYIPKPEKAFEAMQMAEKLAKDFPFVRVDFYIVNNQIYFGELTFTPAAGMDVELMLTPPGENKDVDTILGEKLVL